MEHNIFFGTDYYPEHWDEKRWETDARLMQEMGIQMVRMAEFSWAKMEPAEGEFNFDWLEDAISLLAGYGIKTVLGTPTAAPPAWIIERDRNILPVDSHGRRREFGGRHHDCQSNETYRAHIKRFVTAMAKRFGENENVIGWQIDNELGNSHGDLCMCSSCASHFRKWLLKKYENITNLNERWGNAFWSQEYSNFGQIQPPRMTVTGRNPSMMLDWKRFCSDLIVDFHKFQADIIHEYSPGRFITHNCMGFSDKVSYFDLSKELDFISHDQYPAGFFTGKSIQDIDDLSASLDFIRGVMKRPYWIMEQQTAVTGWEVMGRLPKPGQAALWSMHSIAHGADAICWFRWRSCSFGTEQYWHGILPHSGIPGRTFDELKTFISETKDLMPKIAGSMPKAEVAIVFSYEQEYALQVQPQHKELGYINQILKYYRALYKKNIQMDFVRDTDDLFGYKLVIAPLQYIMTPEIEEQYMKYVENGGNLILTMRTGVKDNDNICMTSRPLPGLLGEMLGIEIPEYDCLIDTDGLIVYNNKQYEISKWCDLITIKGAETIGRYDFEFYKGTPVVTVNKYGRGKAYYIGTEPGDKLCSELLADISKAIGINSLGSASEGVEIACRTADDKDGKAFFFLLNHSGKMGKASIQGMDEQEVPPYSYKVIEQ